MTGLDYALVVPSDWWRIDLTTPEGVGGQVKRLVQRLVGSADLQASLRRELVQHLQEAGEEAARRGGVDLYLAAGGPSGGVLAASLLVTVTPQDVGAEHAARLLQAAVGEDADSATVVELAGGPAVRVVRHEQGADLLLQDRPSLVVQYTVPLPTEVVLLSFATPLLALAEPLTAVFDAVAGSVRFRGGGS